MNCPNGVLCSCCISPVPLHLVQTTGEVPGLEPLPVTPRERVDMALEHARELVAHKGDYIGVREMRKHMAWYLKGLRGAAQARLRFNTAASSPSTVNF